MERPLKFRDWIYHGEWLGLMITIISCFLFVHHENSGLTKRLDDHMAQNQRRLDDHIAQNQQNINELHKRSDDLHREFYELLKEIRNK